MRHDSQERGLLRPELFVGVVSGVSASQGRVNLSAAGEPSASHFEARRYGRGEVGELVLFEGQVDLTLGRIVDIRVPEGERREMHGARERRPSDVSGYVQFLGTVRPDTQHVFAGVATYPRLGDRVYAAPHWFVGRLPEFLEHGPRTPNSAEIVLGRIGGPSGPVVHVRPEKLFGRHCAVLGATGGGKSWTIARMVEECSRNRGKVVLLDATGEYRKLSGTRIRHVHVGTSILAKADGSEERSVPPGTFVESDFVALFEPAGKVQGPRLREAIRSLRLVRLLQTLEVQRGRAAASPGSAQVLAELIRPDGFLVKALKKKEGFSGAAATYSKEMEDPRSEFDVARLSGQVMEECVFPEGFNRSDPSFWGGYSEADKSSCLGLVTRIQSIVTNQAFAPVFASSKPGVDECLDSFFADPALDVLRICLGGVSYEWRAREFLANAIGRMFLSKARAGAFSSAPLIVFLDEAHNFLGRSVGNDENAVRLDAFELIAREGRKYGLTLCLASQRPRDLTEGVLSQVGTFLVVHRLTNDRDREIIERACGEIDRAATAFLANLKQGEAAIIGVDFPIPMTVQILPPEARPVSDGPDYEGSWRRMADVVAAAESEDA